MEGFRRGDKRMQTNSDELAVEHSRVTESIARLMGSGEPSPSTTEAAR